MYANERKKKKKERERDEGAVDPFLRGRDLMRYDDDDDQVDDVDDVDSRVSSGFRANKKIIPTTCRVWKKPVGV